jgi:hypothetical protein
VFRRDITETEGNGALSDLDSDVTQGRLFLADVPWRQALDRAADLSRAHTPALGTRTLDVLHVASAVVLECRTFVTYDDRQAALAKAVGLRLAHP